MSDRPQNTDAKKEQYRKLIREFAEFLTDPCRKTSSFGMDCQEPAVITAIAQCAPLVRGMTADQAEEFITHEIGKTLRANEITELLVEG